MNTLIKATQKVNILKENDIIPFFDVLKANVIRSNMEMTVIFLKATVTDPNQNNVIEDLEEQIADFLVSEVRNTDMLFKLEGSLQWGILLTQNGEEEGNAFLNRIFQLVKNDYFPSKIDSTFTLQGIIVAVKNDQVTFEDLKDKQFEVFSELSEPWEIEIVTSFKAQPLKRVKVSILEENAIFSEVLEMTVQKMVIDHFQLETKVFSDGYEFLQSDWYLSGHTHLVIMNDILPRKNGLNVLHTLRNMANQKKFIIYMMTNRKSQGDMNYAYESGVDEYLIKPFDLNLLQAQLKRTFARL
ncbi:response regulator [Lysinibacillus xylanilyticus]|uniref:Response regulator n=1 Tax=Lysinibacillus xylanilyticus TaxID=582475 RepID=A0ABT4EMX2_9BACI|nr:response regulator [Lysinibacillus xylanilyticus]MCY9546971.1 response regulator [Lysinibacillus xylanilyticus]